MYGGLLKSASAAAIIAAASFFGTANAADLGGDCCADLEERVAELEATTVRKGNRKVSLKISGFVGHQVMWWDDGTQSDAYIADGGNIFSRFRFTGSAKISPQVSAGFTYEFGVNGATLTGAHQGNGGDDAGTTSGSLALRDSTVWLKHNQLGMIKIGQGSTSTDNLILIDLGGKGAGATPDIALFNGGFWLRGNDATFATSGLNWGAAIRGDTSFDTARRNHVMYQSPTLAGFTLQTAVAEDNYWDVALRYAGEFGAIRVAGGIGYQEDSEFNAPVTGLAGGQTTVICTTNCDVKSTEVKGSASIMHVPTGLFLTGAAGKRELSGHQTTNVAATRYAGPDVSWWYLSGGVSKNYFGLGRTVLYGEYLDSSGGLEQASFLTGAASGYTQNTVATGSTSSSMNMWGIGITQHVDAAAMELFASYKNFSLEANGFTAQPSLNKGAGGVGDFQAVIVGTKINF